MSAGCPHCGSDALWDSGVVLRRHFIIQEKDGKPFIPDGARFVRLEEPINVDCCADCRRPSAMFLVTGGAIMMPLMVWDMGEYDGYTGDRPLPGSSLYRE